MRRSSPDRVALLDADYLIYRFAFGNQKEIHWDEDTVSEILNPRRARAELLEYIEAVQAEVGAGRVVIAMTCQPSTDCFRHQVYPEYKASRGKTRKPTLHPMLRSFLCRLCEVEGLPLYIRPGLEGDDVLGILATHPTAVAGVKVVVSLDKDLRTIPGRLFVPGMEWLSPAKPSERLVIKEAQADWWHMYQALIGDAVDGYPGCPGIGKLKGAKMLGGGLSKHPELREVISIPDPAPPVEELWPIVVDAYDTKAHKLPPDTEPFDQALTMARLARILRYGEWDPKTLAPRLWQPPGG